MKKKYCKKKEEKQIHKLYIELEKKKKDKG